MIIYIDGKYLPEDQAKISVFDHGFLYGDGVFEGIRAYNGKVFRLKEHIDRLFDSAKTIDLAPPLTKEEMTEVICEVLRKNNLTNAYIRPIISRGHGDLGGNRERGRATPLPGENLRQRGLRVGLQFHGSLRWHGAISGARAWRTLPGPSPFG